jgi:hypothetical protein
MKILYLFQRDLMKFSCPDSGFSWFFSALPDKFRDSTLKIGHDHFPLHPFQSIIPYHPTIRHYVV